MFSFDGAEGLGEIVECELCHSEGLRDWCDLEGLDMDSDDVDDNLGDSFQ